MSRLVPLLRRFLLLAILLFAAGFCWYNRDTLALTARLTPLQWLLVIGGYVGCYWLNALMACQVQWSRGTQPRLGEMLVINAYASILGYATVLRSGFYSSKLWFYQQRFGLAPSVSLGLQAWVSLLVLMGNALFGLAYGLWLQAIGHRLPWVHWTLVLGTLVIVMGVVVVLFQLATLSWLPARARRWVGNMRDVIASTNAAEVAKLNVQAILNIPLQALALGVLCSAFDLAIPTPYLLLMALVSNLSLIIALTPSNLGVREFVLWQLLGGLDLSTVTLLGVMMVDRIVQFLILVVISLCGFRLLQNGAVQTTQDR
ncbi:MAG: hypothetical protein EXR85_06400 [Xanthomonadales bacterium]|nr:hypothetical protein [Xanthomonadales bacterium]